MSEPVQGAPPEGSKALRAVTRFRCIGPECAESCCLGWRIVVDGEDYERLRDAFAGSDADRALFRECVERMPPERRTPQCVASMRLRSGARCSFLRDDALCSIQARFGEAWLPSGCAVYPRSIALIGDRFEVSAMLSCPEAARLCLLDEDGTELVDATGASLPRPDVQQLVEFRDEIPYTLAFETVRAAFLAILRSGEDPLRIRFARAAWLGRNLSDFVHEKATDIDPLRLALEIERVGMPPMRAAFERELQTIDRPLAPTLARVLQILRQRLGDASAPRLRELVARALQSLALESERIGVAGVDGLLAALTARRERLLARHGPRIDALLTRWAVNHLWQEPWIRAASPLVYVRRFVVRSAVLRFLLFAHPDLSPAGPVAESALDSALVDVVQRVSRAIEHDAGFVAGLDRSPTDQTTPGLADVLGLLAL